MDDQIEKPDSGEVMDQEQWEDFRDSVITQVTEELDRLKRAAETLDPLEATFHGTFQVTSGKNGRSYVYLELRATSDDISKKPGRSN